MERRYKTKDTSPTGEQREQREQPARSSSEQYDFIRDQTSYSSMSTSSRGFDNPYSSMPPSWESHEGESSSSMGGYNTMGDNPLHHETGESRTTEIGGINVAASDQYVAQQYQYLLNAKAFQLLDKAANSNERLTIRDSSNTGQSAHYNPDSHEINVPLYDADGQARSSADVRADIVWEMHNACNRDMLQNLAKLDPPDPGPYANQKELDDHQYKKAAHALASEWFEWSLKRESYMRIQFINKDKAMGKDGNYVALRNEDTIKSWSEFHNYIGAQYYGGHTASYDPAASKADWIGVKIVSDMYENADAKTKDALRVRESVVKLWQEGKRPNIKDPLKNPFVPLLTNQG